MNNTENFTLIKIQDQPNLVDQASEWFHQKWGIPMSAYKESMEESLHNPSAVPEWYIMMDNQTIIGGLGVIENDFHMRKDLTPNICAVYVEKEYRNRGIAGQLLNHTCEDFKNKGINTLYLITDHTSFYERYGWEFLCMVQEEDSTNMTRMYRHDA